MSTKDPSSETDRTPQQQDQLEQHSLPGINQAGRGPGNPERQDRGEDRREDRQEAQREDKAGPQREDGNDSQLEQHSLPGINQAGVTAGERG